MTEFVEAKCPGCQNSLRLPAKLLAKPLRCKRCHTVFQAKANTVPIRPVVPTIAPFVSQRPLWRPAYELLISLAAIVVITGAYIYLAQDGIPGSSSLVGYTLGIVGFLMMLSTEIGYSLRKRVRGFHHGRMSTWLQVHVFTGIVGPYLVLLHSAGKFHGLAGVLTLLTVTVVVSGFIGRYIYTALPRTLDGTEIANAEESTSEANRHMLLRRLLSLWHAIHIPLSLGLFTLAFIHIGAVLYFATFSK